MRVLNDIERLLLNYVDNERQAIVLAPHVRLSADPSEQELQDAVILALVSAKQAISGPAPQLEYVSGQRRDTIRKQLCS